MNSREDWFSGERLYGDDFDAEQIAAWYADEKEAYAELGAKNSAGYVYGYHALNWFHGFRHVPDKALNVLGFGAAYGDELLPIIHRIRSLTIVDPSDAFSRETIGGVTARYVQPSQSGRLPLDGESFDLVTSLGVLHHVPNVSATVHELARVLKPGGHLVLREPIVSMGDWRKPRHGLTKRERGIPLKILLQIAAASGLTVSRYSYCDFPALARVAISLKVAQPYNSTFLTILDAALGSALRWNVRYHPTTLLQKLCPMSVFMVLKKP